MKTFKVWLLLTLVFLAGFAGGIVVTRGVVRHLILDTLRDPGIVQLRIERDLTRRLRLDRAQRVQVHEILRGSHERLQKLRQEFQPQLVAVMQDTRTQISAVLTPEQQKQFEEFQIENRPVLQRALNGGPRE